jgi:F-type H+-transporting ATPase subunit b
LGLGISWQGLVAQLINFGILLVLLYVIAYKPIRRMLDERSEKVKASMEQAEQMKEVMARTEEQVKEELGAARTERQNILAQAEQVGQQLKEEAREQAKQDAEVIVAKARTEIGRERDEAIAELKREFADLAIMAAEKVINETLDKEKHRKLIDEVLEQASEGRS